MLTLLCQHLVLILFSLIALLMPIILDRLLSPNSPSLSACDRPWVCASRSTNTNCVLFSSSLVVCGWSGSGKPSLACSGVLGSVCTWAGSWSYLQVPLSNCKDPRGVDIVRFFPGTPAQFQAVEINYATKALYICYNYYLPHYTPLSLKLWEHLMSPYFFQAYIVHKLVFHPALFHEPK